MPNLAATALASAFGGGALAVAVSQIVVGVAVSSLQRAFARKSARNQRNFQQQTSRQRGATVPQAFGAGNYVTMGSDAFPPYACENPYPGEPSEPGQGRWVHLGIALSDFPVAGYDAIILQGVQFDIGTHLVETGHEFGLEVADGLEEPYSKYRGKLFVKLYDGTQTAADPILLEAYADHPTRPYTADMVFAGGAYAVVAMEHDRDGLWTSLDDIRFVCRGMLVDGSYTDNAIDLAAEIASGITLPNGEVFTAGYAPEDIDADAKAAAAIEVADAGFSCGLEIPVGTPDGEGITALDAINELLASCAGTATDDGGVLYFDAMSNGLPVAHITDEDIDLTIAKTAELVGSLKDKTNGVAVTHADRDGKWAERASPIEYDLDLVTKDGEKLARAVSIPAINNTAQARVLGAMMVKDSRRSRIHALPVRPSLGRLRPKQKFTWTSEEFGYVAKEFVVEVRSIAGAGTVITARESDPDDFNPANINLAPYFPTTPVVFLPGAMEITLTTTAVSIQDAPGLRFAVPFMHPAATGWVVEVRKLGEDSVQGFTFGPDTLQAESVFAPKTTYQSRASYLAEGRPTAWSEWQDETTFDIGFGSSVFWDEVDANNQAAFDRERSIRKEAEERLIEFDIADRVNQVLDTERVDKTVQENKEEIEVSLGDAVTRIVNVETQAAATDAALVTTEQTLQAEINGAISTTQTLTTNLADTDASVAQLTLDVNAGFADVNSSINNVSTALSTAEGALAQDIQTISTSVGDLNSEIVSTNLSIDGVKNTYGVSINNNGVASGFAQTSTLMGEGGVFSDFLIDADAFRVGKSNNHGDYTSPFSVVNDITYIKKAAIKEADIDRLKIANNSVGFSVISTGAYRVGNGGWQDGSSLILWLPGGARCRVKLAWDIDQGYATYPGPTWGFRLRENGIIFKERSGMTFGNDYPSGSIITPEFDVLPVSGGGNRPFTYALEWFGSNNQITATAALAAEVNYK